MTPGTDYAKIYNEAYVAYGQGNYEEAATLIEPMVEAFPEDPDVLLLQGHIHYSLGKYETAHQQYQSVLQRTERKDLLDYANQGLAQIQEVLNQSKDKVPPSKSDLSDTNEPPSQTEDDSKKWADDFDLDGLDWDSAAFNEEDLGEPTIGQEISIGNSADREQRATASDVVSNPFANPNEINSRQDKEDSSEDSEQPWSELDQATSENFTFAEEEDLQTEIKTQPNDEENTFVVAPPLDNSLSDYENEQSLENNQEVNTDLDWSSYTSQSDPTIQVTPMISSGQLPAQNQTSDNVEGFQEDSLKNLANFDFMEINDQLPDSDLFTQLSGDINDDNLGLATGDLLGEESATGTVNWVKPEEFSNTSISGSPAKVSQLIVEQQPGYFSWFLNISIKSKPWIAAGATGLVSFVAILLVGGLGWFLGQKQPQADTSELQQPNSSQTSQPTQGANSIKFANPFLLMALIGGVAGFGSTLFFGLLSSNYIKRTINDLQAQFDEMYAGNYNVKATVISQDELGQLSTSFNQLSRIILTTTSEAQQRAAETEQAREDLQRQVIRLLDDVEGAARGDLTVEAEVTADVLGAVADAFNLTINNLREIVAQVKRTAKQVNQSSTDSELFARNNSTDALRMAEELAVTLNSVQVMTESIQRVAENAREAEEVAHTSSVTALKGGEAVERTVAGILQIRETVSETTRKVKRLAEASQEISKIVALISQIASRTNLLALNASIQAARAGEAGRGFAIVADEVRQLADRSAKSLKEIEQIVLQIQSETGSVMTAMEEGIQQVIDVTDRSEQAKRSLEDIIDVSNHINTLVRSITGDTIQQQENSKAVGQVMQSVELTAQETSHESQRVAGSLQNLVGISRDLLASVERFRIEASEK
ncbi:MAG: methyl-accepting chemotaxis protein [Cyanobacteria bacterium P01_G01_bin.49]